MRERLPHRRASVTFDFECDGLHFRATVSRFEDGRPAEVFVNNHKHNRASDLYVRDAAILASLALQYGAPLEVLRGAIGRSNRNEATSPIGVALDTIAE